MSQEAGLAFKFMRVNYKYGLMDEVGAIAGDALENVLRERGLDMEDVINSLDGAGEDTVERLNGVVEKWSPIALRLAVNDTATRISAWLIRKPPVRRAAVRALTRALLRSSLAAPAGAGPQGPFPPPDQGTRGVTG